MQSILQLAVSYAFDKSKKIIQQLIVVNRAWAFWVGFGLRFWSFRGLIRPDAGVKPRFFSKSGAYPPPPADKCTELSWCKGDMRIKDNLRAWWPFFCSSLDFGQKTGHLQTWWPIFALHLTLGGKLEICRRGDLFLLFTWFWVQNEQL